MSVIYFGTSEFAVPALRAIASSVSLVVSQPDRPSGRHLKLQPSPVKLAATELGLPCETPLKARDPEFVEHIRAMRPDALIVAAYGQILSESLLQSATHGGINLHGSILPEYRGAAPIQRAILDGRTETGVTLMQMDKGMDTGDMISIETIPIDPDETSGELQVRLADLAAQMISSWLGRIVMGDYPREKQDHDRATMAPKVQKADAELNPNEVASLAYNRFRAFTPSPGAFIVTPTGNIKVLRAKLNSKTGTPGTILAVQPTLTVAFQEGSLDLLEVAPPGKRAMSGVDFANGQRFKPGDTL